jgi:hypothetical protein
MGDLHLDAIKMNSRPASGCGNCHLAQ